MIKVSIVVPVYNVEMYIRKCLESLVNQTLKEIEIIVVNDGSTDGSQLVIDEFVEAYPKYVRSFVKRNGGLSDARNWGISYCIGQYVAFLDSDDYVSLQMYEKMYEKAKEENSDIVVCDYYKTYVSRNELIKAKKYLNKKDMFVDTLVAAWNKIYKRELLVETGVLFPKGLIYEDTEFFCKLIPHIEVASYIPEPFVYYVQRDGSISNTQGEKTSQMFQILENIIEFYKQRNLYQEYKNELEYLYLRIMLGSHIERVSRIGNKKLRYELVDRTYSLISNNFINWKKNIYLNSKWSKRHIYMKSVNPYTLRFYSTIFKLFYNIKERTLY
ncbi:glycosyltransferase family 2 protein [Bacillus sp. SJS]|uniref:glycosyltransferase family 2 protein n=1 Tax=Bacillus sp. SJS TaxID=1423321 RepID=UPI0004DCE6A8|nr:glycosyltransferase [Bacillus sp. SJS]KZZ83900.1 hypothetical protein AS29_014215 [Bacillus sp. SJS]